LAVLATSGLSFVRRPGRARVQAFNRAVDHGLGHFQQVPYGVDLGAVVGLQVVAAVEDGGAGAVDQVGKVELAEQAPGRGLVLAGSLPRGAGRWWSGCYVRKKS